jgi:hypothetical protein
VIRRELLALALLLGCEAAPPEPTRAVDAPLVGLTDADCQACHPEVATQWAHSRHHAAFTNEDFSRSYAREPLAFCRDCHAPALLRARPLPDAEAEALGVGCIDCHGEGPTVHTGPGVAPVHAPHLLDRSADFGTRSCARCHEFEFPAASSRPAGSMMQTTMREHLASAHADRGCDACHLPPRADGGRDHSLASTRDPDALRRALAVTATRDGNDLIVTLEPRDIGHAYPTGDLFRRLALHAELHQGGERIAATTRHLARHFVARRRENGTLDPAFAWPEPDDRLRGPTTLRLTLDPNARGELRWWIDLERVDARDEHHPERSTIASTVRIADGSL